MLTGMRMSIQAEFDVFFGHLQGGSQLLRTVSEQAFAQARAKLSLTAIPSLNDWLVARERRLGVCAAERNETSTNIFDLSERVRIDFLGMGNE